ncbi:MHYT domain-containing protein (plasmid) [Streptomyces sp. AHU1]|uniref:MHYT domain-containing protein n=1 Tax=Streptomyces sp. AHU1 TaxID=3377215 RepID=UPI003877CCC6
MYGTVNGFSYGLITPISAYIMACLGGALALRCVTRSLLVERSFKAGWLALGAVALGCGIWAMHFIAMIGFHVEEVSINYDVPLTLLSLAVAIAVVSLGVFIVGYLGAGRISLGLAGVTMGLGVAGMHYIGMASMRFHGTLQYQPLVVTASVVIAVAAATAALWAAVTIRGFLPSLGASLVMGVAVSGMHYTAMMGLTVHLHEQDTPDLGSPLGKVLIPMLLGPLLFLLLAAVMVMFDPLFISGEGFGEGPAKRAKADRSSVFAEPGRNRKRHSSATYPVSMTGQVSDQRVVGSSSRSEDWPPYDASSADLWPNSPAPWVDGAEY